MTTNTQLTVATRRHLLAAFCRAYENPIDGYPWVQGYLPRGVRGFTMAIRGMAKAGLVNPIISRVGAVHDFTVDRYYGQPIEGFALTVAGRDAAAELLFGRMERGLRALHGAS